MVAGLYSPLPLLVAFQDKLQLVADADVNWKTVVIAFSTSVWALETYLMCVIASLLQLDVVLNTLRSLRQYRMYDKKSPPDALSHKLTPEVFEKSQVYGRDKAFFSLVSGTYDQALEVLLLYLDAQAWAWTLAGNFLAKRGYEDYEVRFIDSSSASYWC